jgi:hypothetical protein
MLCLGFAADDAMLIYLCIIFALLLCAAFSIAQLWMVV